MPGPTRRAYTALPRPPSWILGVGAGKGGEGKGGGETIGEEREGKRNGRRRDGTPPIREPVTGLYCMRKPQVV